MVTPGSNGVPGNNFKSSPNFNLLVAPSMSVRHTFTELGNGLCSQFFSISSKRACTYSVTLTSDLIPKLLWNLHSTWCDSHSSRLPHRPHVRRKSLLLTTFPTSTVNPFDLTNSPTNLSKKCPSGPRSMIACFKLYRAAIGEWYLLRSENACRYISDVVIPSLSSLWMCFTISSIVAGEARASPQERLNFVSEKGSRSPDLLTMNTCFSALWFMRMHHVSGNCI